MVTLASDLEPILFITIGGGVILVWIFMGTIHAIFKRSSFEKSRREIAAYVAEGSITPDDAERLLRAESKSMKNA